MGGSRGTGAHGGGAGCTEEKEEEGLARGAPRQPQSASCRVDPYGFERPEDFDYAAYDEFLSAYLAVLTRRALKWSRLLQRDGGLSRTATGE